MKQLLKTNLVEDLNKFMKDHEITVNQIFDIVINHESLPIDKTRQGLRKKIETLKVELDYQKTLKELQELDYDRASVQREVTADLLCDLLVRLALEHHTDDNPFEDVLIPMSVIIEMKKTYLKMFAIKEDMFDDIFQKQLNTARENQERTAPKPNMPPIFSAPVESHSDQVINQMNADIANEIDEYASRHDPAIAEMTIEETPDPTIAQLATETIKMGNEIHHELNERVDKLHMMSENLKHHHTQDIEEHEQEEAAETREEQRAIDTEAKED